MDINLVSIIVPVYNSSNSLLSIFDKTDKVASENQLNYELIFINDTPYNSKTCETLDLLSKHPTVTVISLTRNFGQQAATMCGLEVSKGDVVITMDDDLQHDPAFIPLLLARTLTHDIVIAQFPKKQHSVFKVLTSRIKERFDRVILNKPKEIQLSAYRAITRPVVDGMLKFNSPKPFISAMMLYVSLNITGVEVAHYERMEGSSGYSFKDLLNLFSFLLINNSSLLLELLGRVGILSLILSILYGSYLMLRYWLQAISVSGWTSLMVLILFFGGIQLFGIGVIGTYLIRIIGYSEKKPPYVIKSRK